MKKHFLAILAALTAMLPTMAHAELDAMIYTWGGFDAVYESYSIIEKVFSNPAYRGLFGSFAVVGIVLAGARYYFTAIAGGAKNPGLLPWLWPSLIGGTILVSFLMPMQEVIIFDESLNKQSPAPQRIPKLIFYAAKVSNLIADGYLDIIQQTQIDQSMPYKQAAGGVGYGLLKSSLSMSNAFRPSLQHWTKDCLIFEFQRSQLADGGGAMTMDALTGKDGTIKVFDLFERASNPAVFTTSQLTSPPDQAVNCTQAGVLLAKAYRETATVGSEDFKAVCSQSGFAGDAGGAQKCSDAITGTLMTVKSPIYNAGTTGFDFLAQRAVAEDIYIAATQGSADDVARITANKQLVSQGMASMSVHTDWITTSAYVVGALFLCIAPIALLFCATPLYRAAISFVIGSIAWQAVFLCVDGSIYTLIASVAADRFAEVNAAGDGLSAMLMFPSASDKILAFMSQARSMGMVITTALTSALGWGGGYALTSMAQGLSSAIQASANAGAAAHTPEGRSSLASSAYNAAGGINVANAHKFNDLVAAAANPMHHAVGKAQNDAQIEGMHGGDKEAAYRAMEGNYNLATKDGALSGALHNGKFTQSQLNSGHGASYSSPDAKNRTADYKYSNGGRVNTVLSDTNGKSEQLAFATMQSKVEQAGKQSSNSITDAFGNNTAFLDNITENNGYSSQQVKSVTDARTDMKSSMENLNHTMSLDENWRKEDSEAFTKLVETSATMGFDLAKIPLIGAVAEKLGMKVEASGRLAASDSKTNSASNATVAAVNDAVGKVYASGVQAQHTVSALQSSTATQSNDHMRQLSSSLNASHQTAQTSVNTYGATLAAQQNLTNTVATSRNFGDSVSLSTMPDFMHAMSGAGFNAHQTILDAQSGDPAVSGPALERISSFREQVAAAGAERLVQNAYKTPSADGAALQNEVAKGLVSGAQDANKGPGGTGQDVKRAGKSIRRGGKAVKNDVDMNIAGQEKFENQQDIAQGISIQAKKVDDGVKLSLQNPFKKD